MRSSELRLGRWIVVLALFAASAAHAQVAAPGFAVERLYLSPAGAGWTVMDDLNMQSGLGGALALTTGYARDPLHVSDGTNRLDVVSGHMLTDIGAAITYDRWRFSLDLQTELDTTGHSGTVDGYAYTAPDVNPGSVLHPDTMGDPRVGVDMRLLGDPGSQFRLGASAQLWIPNGDRADYDTDGTYRGMLRALAAGDVGRFAYAGQLGVHIRPIDEPDVPGSPRGSELLFGAAVGAKLQLACGCWLAVFGPEVYGASALRSLGSSETTALEGLLTARFETLRGTARHVRIRVGIGGGLNPEFGAPEWRVVAGIEMFGESGNRSLAK